MEKEEIQRRYKALILPENKSPYHFDKRAEIEPVAAYNPMCGDKYDLYLKGVVDEAYFHGIGCALSKASTSLMIKEIEGKSKEDIIALCRKFLQATESGKSETEFPESLNLLIELKDFDGRLECIQLSWKALLSHLENIK